MGGTNSVNGSRNNYFKLSDFWTNPSLKPESAETVKPSTPIKITSGNNNVQREELSYINPYGSADTTITEAKEIALNTNSYMAGLGYPNYKVSPKTVTSVSGCVETQALPSLNIADDNAVAARVENPNGPFAELFT